VEEIIKHVLLNVSNPLLERVMGISVTMFAVLQLMHVFGLIMMEQGVILLLIVRGLIIMLVTQTPIPVIGLRVLEMMTVQVILSV
jgi:hypothetical protein